MRAGVASHAAASASILVGAVAFSCPLCGRCSPVDLLPSVPEEWGPVQCLLADLVADRLVVTNHLLECCQRYHLAESQRQQTIRLRLGAECGRPGPGVPHFQSADARGGQPLAVRAKTRADNGNDVALQREQLLPGGLVQL